MASRRIACCRGERRASSKPRFIRTWALLAITGSTIPAFAADPLAPLQGKSTTMSWSNPTPIVLPVGGATSLYPSIVTSSGIASGIATKVVVTLKGVTHSYPADLNVFLSSPTGSTRAMLLSDAGGGIGVAGVDVTFSATATFAASQTGVLGVPATVRPANYVNDVQAEDYTDVFPIGPGVAEFEPADLDAFNVTNFANGDWRLYVSDDYPDADGGSIAGGWTVELTTPNVRTVTTAVDKNDGVCDGDCSLREAVATADDGDLVVFSELFNRTQTITLGGTPIAITKSITISGPSASFLSISGNFASRVFEATSGKDVTLMGMTIRDGVTTAAGQSGAGINCIGNLVLRSVAVVGNRVGNSSIGGGVALVAGSGNFVNTTFSDNAAGQGGGIYYFGTDGRSLRLANSTLSGNRALAGAALFARASNAPTRVELVNDTIADNSADGGGVVIAAEAGASSSAQVFLRNTIVARNGTPNIRTIVAGGGGVEVRSQGYNLSDDAALTAQDLASDVLNADPRLGPLTNNGGSMESRALMGGSPALDGGRYSGYRSDPRSSGRGFDIPSVPNKDGTAADIGAVEMRGLIVGNVDDSGPGSLRQAILDANANNAFLRDDILFDADFFAVPRTINLQSALPNITSYLNLVGPGAKRLTLRRDTGGDYRIVSNVSDLVELGISGITLANGRATDAGGILSFGRLSLAEVAIVGNTATQFGGGGLALAFSDGTIRNSTISGNAAGLGGGGLQLQGNDNVLRVVNSTISGNTAQVGAGIAVVSGAGTEARLELSNSTVANNAGSLVGGLLVQVQGDPASSATATLRNSIVANNPPLNLATSSSTGIPGVIDSRGFNLSNDPTSQFLDKATDKVNAAAMLGPLADNGGATRTHALMPGSPAIDAGNRSGSGADQQGSVRPNDQGGVANGAGGDGADIGAVEDAALFRDGFD